MAFVFQDGTLIRGSNNLYLEGTSPAPTVVVIPVKRIGDLTQAVTISWQVLFDSVTNPFVGGSVVYASADDFSSPLTGTLDFGVGESQKYIPLFLAADSLVEGAEYFANTYVEWFRVAVTDPVTGATITEQNAIQDDDLALISISSPSINSILAEGSDDLITAYTFTLTRTGATSGLSTISWVVSGIGDSPADAGDFQGGVFPGGTLTFAAGETTKTIVVNVNADRVVEFDETFAVTLSNPISATIATATATGTIVNDDGTALTIRPDTLTTTQLEGNSGLTTAYTFTVTRTGTTTGTTTVAWAVAGNGQKPANEADFLGGVFPSGVLSFAATETTKTITVQVNADLVPEGDETFVVTLSNPVGATLSTATATATIRNDDTPSLAIAAAAASLVEGSSGVATPYTFTVTRTGTTTGTSTVTWAVSATGGRPVNPADFQGGVLPKGQLTFRPNDTVQTITVNVNPDVTIEFNETFAVTLSGAVGATIATATAIGTIDNDDGTSLAIAAATGSGSQVEGTAATGFTPYTFNVSRIGTITGTSMVNWAVSGVGGRPVTNADFQGGLFPTGSLTFGPGETTKPITVNVNPDAVVEFNETFAVTLSGAVGASLGTATASSIIVNDDGTSLVLSAGVTKVEGSAAGGMTPYTFTVARIGTITGTSTVNWAVTGTGARPANAADFQGDAFPAGQLTFATNETVKTITVNVNADFIAEFNEAFAVTLSAAGGATLGTATTTSTILNDDGTSLQIAPATGSASKAEGSSGGLTSYTFNVNRIGTATTTSIVNWAVSGSGVNAATANDFQGGVLPGGVLTFAPADTAKTITVNVNADTTPEMDEAFAVVLSTSAQAGLATTTATIVNDDLPSLAITPSSAGRPEGSNGLFTVQTFVVSRSGPASMASTVNWTVSGTGANPANAADFQGGAFPSGVLNFAPTETSKTISVNVSADLLPEANDSFAIVLSNPTGAKIAGATATGIILNDDSDPDLHFYENPAQIVIPDNAEVAPVSLIKVDGLTGLVADVTVTLVGLDHPFMEDLDIALVAPSGQGVILLSDVVGDAAGVSLKFSDRTRRNFPVADPLLNPPLIPANIYKPTNRQGDLPDAFPATYSSVLSSLDGISPNGDWQLRILDDSPLDTGTLLGGWMLEFATYA